MSYRLNNLGIVNLIKERQMLLQQTFENTWNEQSDIKISNSEWYILLRIYGGKPTISDISKNVNISRQATHKNIRSLETKGLVMIENLENNKRDKCIRLTPLGIHCYEKSEQLKERIEKQITQKIGEEKLSVLKDVLKMDWGI